MCPRVAGDSSERSNRPRHGCFCVEGDSSTTHFTAVNPAEVGILWLETGKLYGVLAPKRLGREQPQQGPQAAWPRRLLRTTALLCFVSFPRRLRRREEYSVSPPNVCIPLSQSLSSRPPSCAVETTDLCEYIELSPLAISINNGAGLVPEFAIGTGTARS
jgi:hypothetical protein